MIRQMDALLDSWLNLDLSQTTKFKCMKVYRDALQNEGFSIRESNMIACTMQLEVSDSVYENCQEDIDAQLAKFAKLVFRLFEQCSIEFNMSADLFIQTFGKDLSYKMEC